MKLEIADEFILWANIKELPARGETENERTVRLTKFVNDALSDYMIHHRIAGEEYPPTDTEPIRE